MLGDELFKKALHFYMDTWNGKHPIPWDYFNSFNTATGKNLNWFFNNWFFTNNFIDIAVKGLSADKKTITIENIGGFAIPFDVVITYVDKSKTTLHQTPAIWEKNQKTARIILKSAKKIEKIELDGGIFMDATPENNVLSVK
jgi:aminopeptidase N